MNVAYNIWIEQLDSPIIKGQVLDILKNISTSLGSSDSLFLFSFQLFFFRPYFKVFSRFQEFRLLRKKLRKDKIRLITIPVIGTPRTLPARLFNAKWYVLPLVVLQTFPILLFLCVAKRIRILHCRSYPITVSAIFVKKILKTKLVFDPRSDFPEENVSAGRWTNNSLSYRTWKYLEKRYLKESDVTVAISETYVDHFSRIDRKSNFSIIPNNVNIEKFKRDDKFRFLFRSKNNIENEKLIFCYCGSLGNSHWHDPDLYAKYIVKFRSLHIPHCFLFITPTTNLLQERFAALGITAKEYLYVNSNFSDVPKYLSAADIGIVFLRDFKIAMAIKTPEYLAMGLPVITNSYVVGAKEVVEKHAVGLVFDLDSVIYLTVCPFLWGSISTQWVFLGRSVGANFLYQLPEIRRPHHPHTQRRPPHCNCSDAHREPALYR